MRVDENICLDFFLMVTPVGETGGQGWLIFSGAESLKQKKIIQQEEKKTNIPDT